MKTKYALLSCIFCFLIASGQLTAQIFGLRQKNPKNYYRMALSYPIDGRHRVLNTIFTANNFGLERAQVLVYNDNLQLVDSINLANYVVPLVGEPLKKGGRLFWPSVCLDSISLNPYTQQLVVLELDTNYKHIALHKITHLSYGSRNTSNIVHIANRYYLCESISNGTCTLFKLNDQFVKVDSTLLSNGNVNELCEIGGNLMLSGGFPSKCIDFYGRAHKAILDTNLNFIDCFVADSLTTLSTMIGSIPVPQQMGMYSYNCKSIPISKTKTLMLGSFDITYNFTMNPAYVMINSIIDNNNNILKTTVLSYAPINASYNGLSYAAVKGNEIVTTGIIGYNFQRIVQYQNTEILVTKLDTMGNLIWKKEYGGDMYYMPWSIIFTKDGGYLVSGCRYDSAKTLLPDVMESFLLKLDANGNYNSVGIFKNGELTDKGIRCYPNPAHTGIRFDVPFESGIEVAIYNNLGELVLEVKEYNSLSPIDISTLSKAVYYYRIKTKLNNYSGKFLRE